MMAAAHTPGDDHDSAIEAEVANLWADGFDSVDIAESLKGQGHQTTEAKVCRVLAAQREERRRQRQEGGGDA